MKKVELQIAYVLHRRPYRNTSAIIDLFTRDYGRLSVLAKGVRRKQSRYSALCQAFQPLVVTWGGKGDLPVLYDAEAHSNGFQFVGSNLYSGFYLNELIIKLLHPHDPHSDLFETYHACLLGISEGENLQVCLRRFERQLLEDIGYGLRLGTDCQDQPILADQYYIYVLEQGPVITQKLNTGNNLVVRGSTLLALQDSSFSSAQDLKEAKLLMRSVIDYYLGNKSLNSRNLFNSQPV